MPEAHTLGYYYPNEMNYVNPNINENKNTHFNERAFHFHFMRHEQRQRGHYTNRENH